MSQISIAGTSADTRGNVKFKFADKSDIDSSSRRITRTATLDGGVVLNDLGYTDGDRTMKIKYKGSISIIDSIRYIHKTFTTVMISVRDGLFLGALKDVKIDGNEASITILIKEKLTS